MRKLAIVCRTPTPFTRDGDLDEKALRDYLQIFIDARIGVNVASGGSGEGHALTKDELTRLYKVSVETCKGKVGIEATPPEHHTAREIIERMKLAVECGVDVVNLYGPAGWHGYRPTDQEFLAYHDRVLTEIKHPVAVAPNPTQGYSPKPALLAEVCNKYPQVVTVYLRGQSDMFMIEMKETLKRAVDFYVPPTGSLNSFALGAAGLIGGEFNIIPKTFRLYIDCYEAGKTAEMAKAYADMKRFVQYTTRWKSTNPRWLKMAMMVLKIPGGEGGVREPYLMPNADEVKKFTDGLLRLRIPEIDELAKAAGLTIPV